MRRICFDRPPAFGQFNLERIHFNSVMDRIYAHISSWLYFRQFCFDGPPVRTEERFACQHAVADRPQPRSHIPYSNFCFFSHESEIYYSRSTLANFTRSVDNLYDILIHCSCSQSKFSYVTHGFVKSSATAPTRASGD